MEDAKNKDKHKDAGKRDSAGKKISSSEEITLDEWQEIAKDYQSLQKWWASREITRD